MRSLFLIFIWPSLLFASSVENEYEARTKFASDEFRRVEKNIYKKWHELEASSKKILVKYYNDNNVRLIIDYENGWVDLEGIGKNKEQLGTILRTIISESNHLDSILNLDELSSEVISKDELVNKLVKNSTFEDEDSEEFKTKINFNLVADHIKVRAKRFSSFVRKWAKKNKLKPELVMAIIRQESAFNPHAQSHIPAFGLMQVVPKYAGRDVMKQAFGKDETPTKKTLLDPETNIFFGTRYLNMLEEKFKDLTSDKEKVQSLIVASYNCGPERIINAIRTKKIKLESSDVNEQITKVVPEETKNYLKKVLDYKNEFTTKG